MTRLADAAGPDCVPSVPRPRTLLVLAPEHERAEIAGAMLASGYRVTGTPPADAGALAGVIVSDASAEPIHLARQWSERCTTVLISSQEDFRFRLAAARAGVKAIVDRPFDSVEIVGVLGEIDGDAAMPLSVVLVDDDVLASEINAEILRSAGMSVAVVNAPDRVFATVDHLLPDLIVMDLNMPGASGLEIAQTIRLSRRLVAIPVLFLSVERDEERQAVARRFGGDDFLTKPIDPRKLIAQVRMRGTRARTLRTIIERDPLTGLLDRGCFHQRLAQEAQAGRSFCLAILDIDHFKAVNDTHGHASGDGVLQTLSQLLRSGLRRSDIVGRCGGEEFGVILRDIDTDAARRILERIREQFSATTFRSGQGVFKSTFSAGLSAVSGKVAHTDLLHRADRALYAAKDGGRNQVREAIAA